MYQAEVGPKLCSKLPTTRAVPQTKPGVLPDAPSTHCAVALLAQNDYQETMLTLCAQGITHNANDNRSLSNSTEVQIFVRKNPQPTQKLMKSLHCIRRFQKNSFQTNFSIGVLDTQLYSGNAPVLQCIKHIL